MCTVITGLSLGRERGFGLQNSGSSQLVRISVDIPNSLDDLWKITVDKSDAQLPTVLRKRLKIIIDRVRKSSSRVYRSKGGKLSNATNVAVWDRYAKKMGEVHTG